MTAYPIDRIRGEFPSLADIVFFDGAGGTQTPRAVADAIHAALSAPLSQRGQDHVGARAADEIVLGARAAMGDLLAVRPEEVIFGRSATQLTFDLSTAIGRTLSPGDEVVVSRLDHDANIRPWVTAAQRAGASVRWIDFDPATGNLGADDVAQVISDRTKVVALTAASNLLGTVPDISAISVLAREVGALLYVDAVAYAPHRLVDRELLGADLLVCSPYKFCGPHLGVVTGRAEVLARLRPDKVRPSTDVVPERFELGTLPYELLAGVSATVDFLASIAGQDGVSRRERLEASYAAMEAHEDSLFSRMCQELVEISSVRRIGEPKETIPSVLFQVDGMSVGDVSRALGERGVAVSAGTFYAEEAAAWANLGEGGIRVSMAPYTSSEDVDQLLEAVREVVARS